MTPTDLKTPDTSSEASLSRINPPIDPWSSLLISSNLYWSLINLLWSGTCPSAVHQMTVHDSPMASEGFPVTNMTPCLLHFWLLTPQLTHSLTKHADWCAYSFLYSAMSHSPYAYSYMLIPCLPIDYKALIVLLQLPQPLTHFCLPFPAYWSAYWSSLLLTDQFTHMCLSHCLVITYKPDIVLLPIPPSFTNTAYSPLCI